ncbi:strawberry notch-like NTP hydrolase domain-containing protein [Halofilum ochraceum]|uniref:strawberry notch-like NTP hydrolase domain-containing protein n=1 Tax=Halofilum ochraceum TaxID=1611323 RepID=UPI0008DA0B1D|nr:strawberry notch family protein [Halofilum ochraceum]
MAKPWENDWQASGSGDGDKPWDKSWSSGADSADTRDEAPVESVDTDEDAKPSGGLGDVGSQTSGGSSRSGSLGMTDASPGGAHPRARGGWDESSAPSQEQVEAVKQDASEYYAGTTFSERAGERLEVGARNLETAVDAVSLMENYRQATETKSKLESLQDQAEKAKAALQKREDVPQQQKEAMLGRIDNQLAGYQKQLDASRKDFRSRLQSIAENQKKNAETARNPIAEKAVQSESFEEFWTYFQEDPIGVIGQFGTESAPLMASSLAGGMAGGAVGGPAGFAAGMGVGSGGIEFALSLADGLREHGADMNDPQSVKETLAQHGEDIRRKAATRGVAIGLFDAASGKLASTALTPRAAANAGRTAQVARETGEQVAQTGAQGAAGAAGEATAQAATGEELRAGEIAVEGFAEGVTAPVDVAGAAVTGARGRGRRKGDTDAEQPGRSEQEESDLAEFENFMAERRGESQGDPAELPRPVVEVDTRGEARTQAQGDQKRAQEASSREDLGLTPDVERAQRRRAERSQPGESVQGRGAQAKQAPAESASEQRSRQKQLKRAKRYEELAASEEDPEIARDLRNQAAGIRRELDQNKPKESRAERFRRERRIDEEKDDLLTAIQKLGGINTTIETDWKGRLKGQEPIKKVGFPKLERSEPGQGETLDGLAEVLHERGYLNTRDQHELEEKLLQAEKGNPVYSNQADEAAMIDAMEESEARPVGDDEVPDADFERDELEQALREYADMPPSEAEQVAGVNAAINEIQRRAERMDPDATERAIEEAARNEESDQQLAGRLLDVVENAQSDMEQRGGEQPETAAESAASSERRQQPSKREAIDRHLDEVGDLDEARGMIQALREDRRTAKVGGTDIEGVANIVEHAEREANGELKQYQGFLDLDNFKSINDTLGHGTADELIRQFAQRLKDYVGDGNIFHRSGDEFIVQGDDKAQLESALRQAQQDFEDDARFVLDMPDGGRIERNQVRFSYGIAENVESAETEQDKQKQRRKEEGFRSDRESGEGQPAGASDSGAAEQPGADQSGPDREGGARGDADQPQVAEDSEGQLDLAGGRSETEQAAKDADVERERKAADSPPVESGDGDLFSGADKQPDLLDQPSEKAPAESGASSLDPEDSYERAQAIIDRLEEAGATRTASTLRELLEARRSEGRPFPTASLNSWEKNTEDRVEQAVQREREQAGTDEATQALSESASWSDQFRVPDTHFPDDMARRAATAKRDAEARGDNETTNEIEFAVVKYHQARESGDDTGAMRNMNRLRRALGMDEVDPQIEDLAAYRKHKGMAAKRASKFLRDRGLSEPAATDPSFSTTLRGGKARVFRGEDTLTIRDADIGTAEFSLDKYGVLELNEGQKYDLAGAIEGASAVKDFLDELSTRLSEQGDTPAEASSADNASALERDVPKLEKAATALRRGEDPSDGQDLTGKPVSVRDDLIDKVGELRDRVTQELDQAGADVDQDLAQRADAAIENGRRALAGRTKSKSGQESGKGDTDFLLDAPESGDSGERARTQGESGETQGNAEGETGAADSAAQPPLRVEPYTEKSVVVRGDTKPHKDRIKNALGGKPRGLFNNRAGGWIFPRARADDLRRALSDLLPQETDIDAQAQQAATSQQSPDPEPTAAQKEAGNYRKGDLRVQGFDIAVETPKGSYRHNLSERDLNFNAPDAADTIIRALRNKNVPSAFKMLRASNHPILREMARDAWMVRLKHSYGYFRRTEGNDGDAVDVFVGPNPDSETAYIVDQMRPLSGVEPESTPGRNVFDEHKVMLGFDSEEAARKGYLDGFEGEFGKRVLGAITPVDVTELRDWLDSGDTKQPYSPKLRDESKIEAGDRVIAVRDTEAFGTDPIEVQWSDGSKIRLKGRGRQTFSADKFRKVEQEPEEPGSYMERRPDPPVEGVVKRDSDGGVTFDFDEYRRKQDRWQDEVATDEQLKALTEWDNSTPAIFNNALHVPEADRQALIDHLRSQDYYHGGGAPRAEETPRVPEGGGAYFSTSRDYAATYGDSVGRYRLNFRNPLLLESDDALFDSDRFLQPVREAGYDAVITPEGTEVAVLDQSVIEEQDRTPANLQGSQQQSQSELVDDESELQDRTRANMAGESPERATLIALRDALEAATDTMNEGGMPGEFAREADDLAERITNATDNDRDLTQLQQDAAASIRDWLDRGGMDDDLANYLRGIEQAIRASAELPGSQQSRSEQLATDIAAMLPNRVGRAATGMKAIGSTELFEMANRTYGGTRAEGAYTSRDAYDALETGVNLYLRGRDDLAPDGNAEAAAENIRQIDAIIQALPSQTRRSEGQTQLQQFSTPPTHAHAAAWVANLAERDVVLEPSAGTGSLIAPAQAADARVIANEYDPGRAELLERFNTTVHREDAQHINATLPRDIQPSVVLMNPPFSSNLKRPGKKDLQVGARHVEEAMRRLQPGGRLVAILGRGMRPDAASQQVQRFWQRIGEQYNVRANVGISGQAYKQYGTTFDNRIVVMDNTAPDGQNPVTGDVESVDELPALLEEVRNDRPESTEPQAGARSGGARLPQADRGAAQGGGSGRTGAGGVGTGSAPGRSRTQRGERGDSSGRGQGPDDARDAAGTARVSDERGTGRPEGTDDTGAVSPAPDGTDRSGARAGGRTASQAGRDGDGDVSDVDAVTVESADSTSTEANQETELTDDTFESYRPRATFSSAKEHPAKLSESAAMASVKAPKIERQPRIPSEIVESGRLSNIQLEAVALAGQSHDQQLADGTRRGFYIGDGTGVGKGAEIAGIILDNFKRGRQKAVWVSENQKLYKDAQRDADWAGLGKDQIFSQGDVKGPIKGDKGVAFTTYHLLRSKGQDSRDADGNIVKGERRIDQLIEWLGEDFDGVIAFDESHNMANGLDEEGERGVQKASQAALAGIELQDRLPDARVVYVSATGATEVRNLAYAKRLGLWGQDTAFPDVNTFVESIDNGGVAAMEIVAKDLKSLGLYTSRSLSYDDVSYGGLVHELTEEQNDAYRTLARAWQNVMQRVDAALADTENNGEGAADGQSKARARSAFWGAHQRFFNQVITAMKGPSIISDVEQQLENGHSAVLQLVSTNEATQERRLAQAEKEGLSLDDVDVTPLDILMQYLYNSFPTTKYEKTIDENGNEKSVPVTDSNGNPVEDPGKVAERDSLMEEMGSLDVPEGILEQLIDHFGTDAVAEVTGRSRRLVRGKKGREIQKRTKKNVNAEIDEFNKGKRRILIFSDAGGTGASYHADNRIENRQKRYHYLVQPGWRADKAVQGFGRTHRSNQAVAPHYVLASTNLQAEKRFLSSIARRLDQLGALTKGQRDAAGGGVVSSEASLENRFASNAVLTMIFDAQQGNAGIVNRPVLENEMGFHLWDEDGKLQESKLPSVPQFLNRLLSLEPERMDEVFHEFDRRFKANIEYARQQGQLDTGMETLRADSIQKVYEQESQLGDRPGALRYVELETRREAKLTHYEDLPFDRDGLFFGRNKSSGYLYAFVPTATTTDPKTGALVKQYRRIGPTGADYLPQAKYREKYETASDSDAELRAAWQQRVDAAPNQVKSSRHLIVGALLPVWDRLPTDNQRVLRVQTDDGERLLGRELPAKQVRETLSQLGFDRPAQDLSPAAVREAIMDRGAPVKLTNGWQLERRRVDNEQRMEVKGPRGSEVQQLKQLGATTEIIAHKTRVFIPTAKAETVLGELFQSKPPQEIVEEQSADDEADGARFSRSGERPANPQGSEAGINVDEARSAAARLMRDWKERPATYVRQSENELPADLRQEIDSAGARGEVRGVFWKGRVYLVADNIPSQRALEETVLHEVIGHYGLRRAIGKDIKPLLRQVWMQYGRSGLADIAQRQGLDLSKPDHQLIAAEEKLAEMAESGAKPNLLQRLAAKIRDWLRRMGFSLRLTDSELLALVARARDFVQRGRRVSGQDSVLDEARAKYSREYGEAGAGADASMFSRHSRSGNDEKPRMYARAPDGSLAGVAEYSQGKWHVWLKRDASGRLFDDGPRTHTEETIGAARKRFTGAGLEVTVSMPRVERQKSEPLFSDGFDMPAAGTFDYIRYNLQDKYVDLLKAQGAIEQYTGAEIPDDLNAYMKESLYHGRADDRVNRFREEHVDPLVESMRDNGVTMDELDEYLYARHAPERNAAMSEINPELQEGEGSGMTDAEAAAVMERIREEGRMEVMESLAARVDAIVEMQRGILVFEGLERAETVQAWRNKYDHYVPLRGFAEVSEDAQAMASSQDARGKGFNLAGGRQKSAMGRRSRSDSPLTHVLANYEAAAVRAEKAHVGRALMRLIQANPNPRLWEVDKVEIERRINPQTGLVESRVKPSWTNDDNELVVKVAGEDHRITLHGDQGLRIASAMKNLGADQINVIVRAGAWLNRWLSWTRTGANPEFIISNFMRDLQTAGINLAGTKADDMKWRILKDVRQARKGIRDEQKGGNSEWAKRYREFKRMGAKTGWVDTYASTDDAKKALEKRIKRARRSGAHPGEMLQAALDFTENVNISVENAVRLSAFENARRSGVSEQQAASIAKELTVNFNRKGHYGTVMNAAYLFYNAGLQGTTRMLQALGSKKVRKIAYSIVGVSAAVAMGNRIWGGEDEDGIPYYDKLPDWLKSRYFVVMLPGTEGQYVSVPLPYGYNIMHVMGQEFAAATEQALGMRNDYDASDSSLRVMATSFESFNPLGSEATPAQFITPTVLDPAAQVWENRDWSGRRIYPTGNPFDRSPDPDSHQSWSTTPDLFKTIAQGMNDATGGTAVTPGWFDVHPESLERFYEFGVGGLGTFISDSFVNIPTKLAKGQDIQTYEIPFLSKLYGESGFRTTRDGYYDALRRIGEAEDELEGARKRKTDRTVGEVEREYRPELQIRGMAKSAEKKLKSLNDRIENIRKSKAYDSRAKSKRIENLRERKEDVMLEFSRAYRQAQQY